MVMQIPENPLNTVDDCHAGMRHTHKHSIYIRKKLTNIILEKNNSLKKEIQQRHASKLE